MPCYNPITIVNPTKYINVGYRDRYLIQVPCGHCAHCEQMRSNEWYFRTYYQTLETFDYGIQHNCNAFVVFDTLTYKNECLPHMSDFMAVERDYPCFNSHHLRIFVAALRQVLKRKFNSNFTYFISSEYGTNERKSHRPHYHALFYVTGNIQPLQFSALVAQYWKYGRTDGIPYKSPYYVLGNVFTAENANSLRCCRYVSKYVRKSCKFQKEIDFRIESTMKYIANRMENADMTAQEWLSTDHAALVRRQLKRRCNQFHRQSTQFGSYALTVTDVNQIFRHGTFFMPDSDRVKLPIGLPTYYKRKLFYETITVDGVTMWTPTDYGRKFLESREKETYKRVVNIYKAVKQQFNLPINPDELANYNLNYRGRFKSKHSPSTLEQRLRDPQFFNYTTFVDNHHLGWKGVVRHFAGNSKLGYRNKFQHRWNTHSFSKKFVFLDDDKERELDLINSKLRYLNKQKQDAYERKQELVNLYHQLWPH